MDGFYKVFNSQTIRSPVVDKRKKISKKEKRLRDKLEDKEKAFHFFTARQKTHDGSPPTLSKEQLPDILMSLGLKPLTEDQWFKFQAEMDREQQPKLKGRERKITLSDFLFICDQQKANTNNRAQLTAAFETLDPERTGLIDKDEFDHLMTYCGETMTDKDYSGPPKGAKKTNSVCLEDILSENGMIVEHVVESSSTGENERKVQIRYNKVIDLLLNMDDKLKTASRFDSYIGTSNDSDDEEESKSGTGQLLLK